MSFGTISNNSIGFDASSSNVIVDHSIVYGNVIDVLGASCDSFSYSDLGVDCTSEPGNIDTDPQYVDAVTGDYRLAPQSPAVDAGAPAEDFSGSPCTDFNGMPRLQDADGDGLATPDMGSYERPNIAETVFEVPLLTFDTIGIMRWSDVAERYNIYRDLVSRLSYDNFGVCYVSGLFSPNFYDLDDPPIGDGFFYLVTGEDEEVSTEGSSGLGTCAERSTLAPCP